VPTRLTYREITDMDKLTEEKFEAVTGYSMMEYIQFTSFKKYDRYKNKYKVEDFKQILTTPPLSEFAEPLYYYLILGSQRQDHFLTHNEQYNDNYRQDLSYKEELVVTLMDLLSGGNLRSTIPNLTKPHVIHNKKLLDLLQSAAISTLRNTINELGLNEYPLPKELAIEEINSHSDIGWVERWMELMGYIDPDLDSFTLEKFDDYFNKLAFSPALPGLKDRIREEMIEEYAYDHPQEADLDIEELNRILAKIKEVKSKRGRKEDTSILKHIAYSLSILLRLNRYLKDKSIEKIDEVDITNEDRRYIHDMMSFFNLIIDYREDVKRRKSLEKRIRKMIEDFNDLATIEDDKQKLQVFKFYYLNKKHNPPS
jgi:hypothetical protein